MPDSSINSKVGGAKNALAATQKHFPQSAAPVHPTLTPTKPAPPAPKPAPTIADELQAKGKFITQLANAPKMHNGGPVVTDGVYQLKAGEHVLTAPEAAKARKHALMASGMKSLSLPGKASPVKPKATAGQPAKPKTGEKGSVGLVTRKPGKDESGPIKLKK